MNRRAQSCVGLLVGALLLAASVGHANGRFPQAGQVALLPAEPERLLVRATFGLLASQNAGKDWGWICEAAPGYADLTDPYALLLPGNAIAVATTSGVVLSADDGCNWRPAQGMPANAPATDLVAVPGQPHSALALLAGLPATQSGLLTPTLWRTTDAGNKWQLHSTLPQLVQVLTVEAAASDPMRLYVTGVAAASGKPRAQLLRSDDSGKSWQTFSLAGSASPWLSAVDPDNADRLWLRRSAPGLGDTLARSDDGGVSWQDVFAANGSMRGFALSPSGDQWLAGVVGPGAGLYWGQTAGTSPPQQLDSRGIHALRWSDAGIFACGADADGFAVARRTSPTGPWQVLLRHADVKPLACAEQTLHGQLCPAQWPAVAAQTGASAQPQPDVGSRGCVTGRGSGPGAPVGYLVVAIGYFWRRRWISKKTTQASAASTATKISQLRR